jgi:hypothetical protein
MILKNNLLLVSLLSTMFVVSIFNLQIKDGIYTPPAAETAGSTINSPTETVVPAIDRTNNSDSTVLPSSPSVHMNWRSNSVPTATVAKSLDDSDQENKPEYKPIRSPYVQEYASGDVVISDTGTTYPSRTYKTQSLPNDPAADQWWVHSATLPTLWDTASGTSNTLLAIIDTGFALDHEEFAGRWYQNTSETGLTTLEAASKYNCSDRSIVLNQSCNLIDDNYDGIVDNEAGTTTEENPSQLNCSDQLRVLDKLCNMIDDDDNGLVDDWRGWDFMNFDNSVQAGDINPNGSGTKHGSYVTGVAAANANNGKGIAGVNWKTKILPIQALGDNGSGTSISVARGIRYAVAQGADVISMSLGGSYPDSYTREAIKEAIANGVIVVAASGNDGCDCISYPANYPEVVAVGALDESNNRAYFSSYGDNLDILAPGTNLYTASWSPSNQTTGYAGGISGTSLATPIVSGLLTSLTGVYPDLAPSEIVAIITENTNRLSMASDMPWSATLGHGTIDSYKALQRPLLAQSPAIRYGFAPISHGDGLSSSTNYEPITAKSLHACEAGQYGSTKVYKLTKSAAEFYSVSEVEIYHAVADGYSKTFFAYTCIGLPVDRPYIARLFNIHAEFGELNKLY